MLKERMFFKGNNINTLSYQSFLHYVLFLNSYFRDPERTAATIDEHGWHHTGDIGQWLPNGTMKIIDRKKHIFKLSQGEYIVPEKIENIYIKSQYIEQVFVHGESLKVKCIKIYENQILRCKLLFSFLRVVLLQLLFLMLRSLNVGLMKTIYLEH